MARQRTEADEYRTELRRRINRHCGVGRATRRATQEERRLRAAHLWLYEGPLELMGDSWTIGDVIERLVRYRFPEEK